AEVHRRVPTTVERPAEKERLAERDCYSGKEVPAVVADIRHCHPTVGTARSDPANTGAAGPAIADSEVVAVDTGHLDTQTPPENQGIRHSSPGRIQAAAAAVPAA
ncbi:hypothetical protein EC988_004914, partial [Linderina pennispora]